MSQQQQVEPEDPALWGQPDPPENPRVHTQPERTAETAEQRARRCPFHKHCVCDHTECRNGWLDEDVPDPTPMDPMHVRNARCPRCADAQEMHTELQGMRGGRRR